MFPKASSSLKSLGMVALFACLLLAACSENTNTAQNKNSQVAIPEEETAPPADENDTGEAPVPSDIAEPASEPPPPEDSDTSTADTEPPAKSTASTSDSSHSTEPSTDPSEPPQLVGITWTNVGPGGGAPVQSLAVSGNTVFAGSDVGGIYRSQDGGESWPMANSGLLADLTMNAHSVAASYDVNGITIDPKDPSHVFLATNSGVFESTDGGDTFEQILHSATPTVTNETSINYNFRSSVVTIDPRDEIGKERLYVGTGDPGVASNTSSYWYSEFTNGVRNWTQKIVAPFEGKKAILYSIVIDPLYGTLLISSNMGIAALNPSGSWSTVHNGLPPSPSAYQLLFDANTRLLYTVIDIKASTASGADLSADSNWQGGVFRATLPQTLSGLKWQDITGTLPRWTYDPSKGYSPIVYRGFSLAIHPDTGKPSGAVYVGNYRSGDSRGSGIWQYKPETAAWSHLGHYENLEPYWIGNAWGRSFYTIAASPDGETVYAGADDLVKTTHATAIAERLDERKANLLSSSAAVYGFENSSLASAWTKVDACAGSSTTASCVTSTAHRRSGNYSLKIADNSGTRAGVRSSAISVSAGGRYFAGAYARVQKMPDSGESGQDTAAIRLLFYNSAGQLIDDNANSGDELWYARTSLNKKTPWLYLPIYTQAPSGAVSMRVQLDSISKASEVYFDDVKAGIVSEEEIPPFEWIQLLSHPMDENTDPAEATWLGSGIHDLYSYDVAIDPDHPDSVFVGYDDIRLWRMAHDPGGNTALFNCPVLDDTWYYWNDAEAQKISGKSPSTWGWTEARPLSGDAAYSIGFHQNARLYLGATGGAVYSDDKAENFYSIPFAFEGDMSQDAVRLTLDDPNTLYAQVYTKGLFKKKTDEDAFSSITSSLQKAAKAVYLCNSGSSCTCSDGNGDGKYDNCHVDHYDYLTSGLRVDPINPEILYAGFVTASGEGASAIQERYDKGIDPQVGGGLWFSKNGGNTWEKLEYKINGANVLNTTSALALVPKETAGKPQTLLYVGTFSRYRNESEEEGGLYLGYYDHDSQSFRWQDNRLFKGTKIGAIAVHPDFPDLILLSYFQNAGPPSGQGKTGIHVSYDAGTHWNSEESWPLYNSGLRHHMIWNFIFHPTAPYLYATTPGGGLYIGKLEYQ